MDLLTLLENEPVEWMKLGNVVEVAKGQQLNKTELSDVGEFPAYNGGKTYSGWTNQYNVEENTIIISQGGASAGYVNFVTSKFWANAHCYYIKKSDKVNNRYIYHVLKMNQESFMQSQHGSGIPALKLDKINKFEIPIPSLETQEKIVKILDKFTEYVTELQTELQKRIDQYTYYRDTLLSEEYIQKLCKEMEADRQLQVLALSEVFEFKNGLNKGKEYFGKGVPFVSYMNVYKLDRLITEDINDKVDVTEDEIERFSVQRGDVLFTRTSEVKDEVGYSSVMLEDMEKCVFNGFTIRGRLKNNNLLLPEFSAHLFRSYSVRKEIIKRSSFTTRASLSGQELGKVEVMIPPLSLQHKIVTILDKFQTMIADAKGLLPREIKQRQQQYEYYREKLLTFSSECDSTHARTHAR